ncbi:MAG: hypothetical protein HRT57_01370 [Crocinitomicaceae bacterium]|nr:hypothetical protein [Crocinitomicaceae bacterium]
MSGGKETPRQKMIGMMYLVLTALLALNVSKSILDAFVAIEENMQKANLTELFRGDEKKSELKETAFDDTNPERARKAKILFEAVEQIDKITAERIREIDGLKMEILKACGEDVSTVSQSGSIIMEKYNNKENPLKPIRMNLSFVNGKDKYDDPMRIMLGEETDIKNPKGKGLKLWNSLNKYRAQITELVASTHVYTNKSGKAVTDTKYSFKAPSINKFKDQADLNRQIKKSMSKQNVHLDDKDAILEIYRGLTKEERMDVDEMKGVHWIGKTFDHSPSVAAIASLSSLQKEILAARASAITTIRSRVGGGEYSFNHIIPLAYGPEVVNANEEFTVEVLMAAYDSDKKPEVVYNGEIIKDVRNGKGYIKLKGSGSTMELSGTVSIRNKSGLKKEMAWTKTITVMKPQGSIEMPQYNILYRGYDNIVNATASGYASTVLTPSNATAVRFGEGYIVRPGSGRSSTLTVSGRTADGRTVQLKKVQYKVVSLPDPTLYLGSSKDGGKCGSSRLLQAKLPPEIPLNAKYKVLSWKCSTSSMRTHLSLEVLGI